MGEAATATAHAVLDLMPEDTVEAIEAKRAAFESAEADDNLARERLRGDLFCAAFFAPKTELNRLFVPLSGDLNQAAEGQPVRPGVEELTQRLSAEHHFFHWRLAFPEVFAKGGFDVVLANPPWEVSQLSEEEFFATRDETIARRTGVARKKAIATLETENPRLWAQYLKSKREYDAVNTFARGSDRYPLTASGKVNLYALFSECIAKLSGNLPSSVFTNEPTDNGRAGFIVPTGIATDDGNKLFFDAISSSGHLASLYDFENREKLFLAVDSRMKFCALTLGREASARFVFFATNVSHLRDERRAFTLSGADIALLNPNTRTCPVFRSQADAALTKNIYSRIPILIDESKGASGNPWGITFRQGLFNMTTDSALFHTAAELGASGAHRDGPNWIDAGNQVYVPLYEAKMVHQYDHRWATYEDNGSDSREMTEKEKSDPSCFAQPRYWVKETEKERVLEGRTPRKWLMGWRDITNATNERTVIASVVPNVGVGNKLPLIFPGLNHSAPKVAALVANFSTICFDFVARQKIGGTTLNYFYIKQFPVLPPDQSSSIDLNFIVPRVLELTYTAKDLAPFARDLGCDKNPFDWNPVRRALLRAELDAYYAKLYGLTRDELRYVLDPADVYGDDYPSETFRVLKSNEIRQLGEYRTCRLVLDAWDRLIAN
jgi:hypothetical protein